MKNLRSPWRLPPSNHPKGLPLLRQVLLALLKDVEYLKPALRQFNSETLEYFRHHELSPWFFRIIAQYGLQAEVEEAFLENLRTDYVRALQSSALEEQEILRVIQSLSQA